MAHSALLTIAAVSKHLIAGIVLIVVGALVALFGLVQGTRRASGAALVGGGGIIVIVIGVLLVTRTIK